MINIRPVSDLRNKFPEVEENLMTSGEPIFLTKNGYGAMVIMSIEQYARLTDDIEMKLNEADIVAEYDSTRYTCEDAFAKVRKHLNG